jgi:hypothetical protein
VVDEAGDVTADRSIAAPDAIDTEHPDATLAKVPHLAGLALLPVANEFAGIVDNSRVLRDRLDGKDAAPVDD